MSDKSSGQPATKVLVFGWYHQSNVGDQLFIDAFKNLFPSLQMKFVNQITFDDLKEASAVFFGGGSFLYAKPIIEDRHLPLLKQKDLFYIGVGIEGSIHEVHIELIKLAKLIAIRSPDQLDRIKSINPNTIAIPDIVYSLTSNKIKTNNNFSKVLILPNICVVPNNDGPNWQHTSWNYFKSEFSQFLDLIVKDVNINFFSMCKNNEINDDWAAIEIINSMTKRRGHYLLNNNSSSFDGIMDLFSSYDLIITQRFHGIVLADIAKVPYIAIHHHDKIKNPYSKNGKFIPYYGLTKNDLLDKFNLTKYMNNLNIMPIEPNIFEGLKEKVMSILR